MHLAVDPVTHDIVTAEVSLENVHDAEVLPTLLNPLRRRKLGRIKHLMHSAKAYHETTPCNPSRGNQQADSKKPRTGGAVSVLTLEGARKNCRCAG